MLRDVGLAAALLALGATGAQAQGMPGKAVTVRGDCTELVVFGDDWSSTCVGSLTNVIHANGVLTFMFSAGDRALLTFIGRRQRPADGGRAAVLQIDGVQVIPMRPGARHAEFRAQGECRFSDPFAGPMRTRCLASAPQGRFSADFMTDGGRPDISDFRR